MVSTYYEGVMSVKGQVVVPQAIREAAGLHAGARLKFYLSPTGKVEIEPIRKTRLQDIVGMLHRPNTPPLSLHDIDRMIMDAVAEEDHRVRKQYAPDAKAKPKKKKKM